MLNIYVQVQTSFFSWVLNNEPHPLIPFISTPVITHISHSTVATVSNTTTPDFFSNPSTNCAAFRPVQNTPTAVAPLSTNSQKPASSTSSVILPKLALSCLPRCFSTEQSTPDSL